MATAIPDLSTLTSSAQIFSSNHTLPQIRTIHKALHAEVDDKAARLRTQVGASYRELLGTADAIVRMRDDMDAVQSTLGLMGARCGRAVVGGKVAGLARFVREREEDEEQQQQQDGPGQGGNGGMGAIARAKLLDACVLAVGRMLRPAGAENKAAGKGQQGIETERLRDRGDRLVVAAKVLVLGRLLVKSLEDDRLDVGVRAAVEALKKKRESLARKLLRGIERVLQTVGEASDREAVLKALCAYSLATSSGARDVVRHFLRVRGESMALAFEVEEHERERSPKDVVRSLGLYTRTLLDVQALVPGRLTDALVGLKKDRLLADESLRELEGLRLDIYEKWCGDEIQFFKPYIRHDDLDGKQARDMVSSWAAKGGEVLLQGLEKTLERSTELKAIVDTRTEILQIWIRDGGKAKGLDPSVMLDKLRETINARVVEVLSQKVNKLRLVGSEVAAALESWREGITDKHRDLWDLDGLDMDLSNGASQFTQDVIARLYGRNDIVSRAVTSYKSWYRVIDDVGGIVDQLRRQRWDNDVDEIEDEETLEQRQKLLSKDDPQNLHDYLNKSMEKAFSELDAKLSSLWDEQKDGSNDGQIAMYLLRILRDIRGKLPKLDSVKDFGIGMVPSLQEKIAVTVALSPLDEFATSALTSRIVVGRSLWEGDPELPTSPSPGLFRLLRDLTLSMGDAGMDLWSPTAVSILKQHLGKQVNELWREALAAIAEQEQGTAASADTPAQDGDDGSGKEKEISQEDPAPGLPSSVSPEQRNDLLVQWLFDILMLRCSFDTPGGSPADEVKRLEEDVYQQTGLESAERQRLTKASQDYWKRTSLLFGLLA
ncbi:Conserved oligomeric Golgi complex subunit 1 [Pleurostoma richardsiae]|uniref:Conserved oligomeric Golgi complex subunit 1 n=1 Tax=Pleurostoma richardsiae TaxID=41990 RepID=A0AA38RQL5_9PEZI|nr:Conserved oligomeric Golgi complex subunit 1 [Pleurostoma richardsiae]